MAVRPWTTHEALFLEGLAPYGSIACAEVLERSRAAVETQARRLGIFIQPWSSDKPFTRDIRQLLSTVEESIWLPECPLCRKRPATYRPEGVCYVCWLDRCVQAADERDIRWVRQRELGTYSQRDRQRAHRQRTCSVCGMDWSPRADTADHRCPRCRS